MNFIIAKVDRSKKGMPKWTKMRAPTLAVMGSLGQQRAPWAALCSRYNCHTHMQTNYSEQGLWYTAREG